MTSPTRRASARLIVARLRQQAGQTAPRMPPMDELLELAEAYIAEVGDEGSERATLGETGQIYATLAAARSYSGGLAGMGDRLGDEAARRELTELALDAKESTTKPGQWRVRRRSSGLDLSLRVMPESRLLVITAVNVRPR